LEPPEKGGQIMIPQILILIISLVLLVFSSGLFVKSSSKIAKQLGVSDLIIGLTLVAIGTSVPELFSGIFASISKQGSLTIGNVVGANVTNIAMIFGISLLMVIYLKKNEDTLRELKFLFLVYILFFIFCLDLKITLFEGMALLLMFVYYMFDVLRRKKKPEEYLKKHIKIHEIKEESHFNRIKNYFYFILSLLVLIFSAKYLVSSAVDIANFFNISKEGIGVLIAIGTTFPELSVTIQAARKKFRGILVGDLIGSCIINILLIIGVASVISPIKFSSLILYFNIPVLFLVAFIMYLFFKHHIKNQKVLSYSLIGFYFLFLILELILI